MRFALNWHIRVRRGSDDVYYAYLKHDVSNCHVAIGHRYVGCPIGYEDFMAVTTTSMCTRVVRRLFAERYAAVYTKTRCV